MPKVSIIIPLKKIKKNFHNNLFKSLDKQSYKNFETIVISDKKLLAGPADKRDFGVKKAKGKIIAFIDDDAYPSKNWLKNALPYFKNKKIAAVCGPGITPNNNNIYQKVSGYVWSSWLGAGGAGTFRNSKEKKRLVDDYPTFNLIVRKKDFLKAGRFNSHFWPGEDTKLCHDLVYKLGKKIVYDPKILVFHHRRPIFIPHLKQIARFGLHRGFFVKILPQTSKRIGYFIPLLFIICLIIIPLIILLLKKLNLSMLNLAVKNLFSIILISYISILILTGINVYKKSKSLKIALLLIPTIFLTHTVYGIMFLKGLLIGKLRQ